MKKALVLGLVALLVIGSAVAISGPAQSKDPANPGEPAYADSGVAPGPPDPVPPGRPDPVSPKPPDGVPPRGKPIPSPPSGDSYSIP